MKIILSAFIFSLSVSSARAQQQLKPLPALDGKPTRTMTTEEANKLNGNTEPTINGIPYSQYRAEQEALKAKANIENVPRGLKLVQAAPATDPAAGRKNETPPVATNIQNTPAETTAPVAKPAPRLGASASDSKAP